MDIHLEEQQARQQTVVNVSSGLWVVDSGPRGGAVRILSIDAASVAHGNATLTFVVRNELFSADWLGGVTASPSSAADPAAVLEVSRAVAPVRVYHDEGWGAGWAAVVQPSIASVHLRHPTWARLALTLPRAARYEPRAPELVHLSLPSFLFSCKVVPSAAPPIRLLVHRPRLALTSALPTLGPSAGGTVVRVRASGVASQLALACFFGDAPAVPAREDPFDRGSYLCTTPALLPSGGAGGSGSAGGSGGVGVGMASLAASVPLRIVQPNRLEGMRLTHEEVAAAAAAEQAAAAAAAAAQLLPPPPPPSPSPPPSPQPSPPWRLARSAAEVLALLGGVRVHSVWAAPRAGLAAVGIVYSLDDGSFDWVASSLEQPWALLGALEAPASLNATYLLSFSRGVGESPELLLKLAPRAIGQRGATADFHPSGKQRTHLRRRHH